MKKQYLTSLFFVLVSIVSAWSQENEGFYDVNTIQQIDIEFNEDKWNYILDSLRYNGDELLTGKVTINGQTFNNSGIRYAATRALQIGSKRNTLEILLDPSNESQKYQGIKAIKLSIALRDPSMVREVLSYEIYRHYIPAPRANYARLNVNDEYVGLFVNIEVIDDQFLSKNYKDKAMGTLYQSAPNWFEKEPEGCERNYFASLKYEKGANCFEHNFIASGDNGFEDLVDFSRILNQESDKIDNVLNTDQMLWMLALNNTLINLYSYSGRYNQNYFLFRDSEGVFHPIPGDMNLAFGSFKNVGVGSDLSLSKLQQLDPFLHEKNKDFPLISQLLNVPSNKKLYRSHLRTIYDDYLKNEKYLARAKELQALIKDAFVEDPYKTYKEEDFKNSLTKTIGERSRIPGLEQLMKGRTRFLGQQQVVLILPPDISEVEIEKREKFSPQQLKEFRIHAKVERFPEEVHIYYRFNPDNPFQSKIMLDDGKNYDGEADDEVYGTVIQPISGATTIEYYIVAENSKAVGFSPADYVNQRHESSLAVINQ